MLTMGAQAARRALEAAQVTWQEIDLIIDCSTSRYRPIPCNAAHYQHIFGREARGIPCFDVQSTCLGFIVALQTANALMMTESYRHILIVASEAALTGVNWQQPESAGLMSDGAAAAVLRFSPTELPLVMMHETFGEYLDLCKVDGGAHYLPAFEYREDRRSEFLFDMNGPALFRVAASRLPAMVRSTVAQWAQQIGNPDAAITDLQIIPHQASPKALDTMLQLLRTTPDRFQIAVRDIGNMAAASLPFMLDQYLRRPTPAMQTDEPIMLLGTSAGYSQAAMIFYPRLP
jgi:3-oxoacyl-[acyl-carrier-protein] synthase-3